MNERIDIFERERPRLKALAYRMLGSVADAEDAVQDGWLRWREVDLASIDAPAAWLVRVVTRLCIDRLRSARARREAYVGPWLPDPLVGEWEAPPSDGVERAEEVGVAFLLALERLSPLERAVFLLREVFDCDYAEVARTLDRSEAACRQLAGRAKAHLKDARPRFPVPEEQAVRLAAAFKDAAQRNDPAALGALLAEDAVMITDGGGRRKAALRPLIGREDVVRLMQGLASRQAWPPPGEVRPARINGLVGFILTEPNGDVSTFAFEAGAEGLLTGIYVVRNPDKLRHLTH